MGIECSISKKLEGFSLNMDFSDSSSRIGILGASGAGKSMTLKIIAGIEKPDSGRIVLNDRVLYDSAEKKCVRPQERRVGYLFQNYALFPNMNVEDNIAAGLKGKREENQSRVQAVIERFHLGGLEKRLPSELSGGQQQRVALARIMAYEPDAILLDEPFSALDHYLKDKMQEELIRMLEGYKGLVVMVSHSRDEIYRFSDSLLIMDKGKIETRGSTGEVFKDPETRAAARLTGCKNIADIRVLDDYTIEVPGWETTLKLENKVPGGSSCIGYRAHEFEPVWGEREENCIEFKLRSVAGLPFEKNYYIGTADTVTWVVERKLWPLLEEKGLPSYLKIRESEILFLK